MWFTETPWAPIIIVALAAALLLVGWYATGRGKYLIGAGVMLPIALAIYFVEQAVVSEAERVEEAVHAITTAFQQDDLDRTMEMISPQSRRMRDDVARAMEIVNLEHMRITDLHVDMRAQGTMAVSRFRVNATINAPSFQFHGAQPTFWQLSWQKENGQWKALDYQRLDVMSGEPIGAYEAR